MANTIVRMSTTKGDIVIEMADDKAPLTVANFLSYVKSGFFDGTIFHRVIPGFMIQGGGMIPGLVEKEGSDPIRNEAANKLSNVRGSLAMARTSDPHSASSQFFINLVNNDRLDYRASTPAGFGYCVFAMVTSGLDVVDAIAKVPTGSRPPHDDVPKEDVIITKAKIE